MVEHRRHWHVGGADRCKPGGRQWWWPLRVDQRNVDGVAARRRRCRADSVEVPEDATRRSGRAHPVVLDAHVMPGELARERSTAMPGRQSGQHVLLWRRPGERAGGCVSLTLFTPTDPKGRPRAA